MLLWGQLGPTFLQDVLVLRPEVSPPLVENDEGIVLLLGGLVGSESDVDANRLSIVKIATGDAPLFSLLSLPRFEGGEGRSANEFVGVGGGAADACAAFDMVGRISSQVGEADCREADADEEAN